MKTCFCRCRFLLVGILFGYLLGGFWANFGRLAAEESTSRPFRRVFVPENLIEDIPTRGLAYWPMAAKEFEQWAKSQSLVVPEKHFNAEILAESARYRATLLTDGTPTLEGTAEIRLQRVVPAPLVAGKNGGK